MTTKKAALSFTGGKDCLLALSEVNNKLEVEVTVLVTFGPPEAFLTEEEDVEGEGTSEDSEMKMKESNPKENKRRKKTFLAHPLRVIKMQALAIGLPHVVIPIEGPNYLESYAVSERGERGRNDDVIKFHKYIRLNFISSCRYIIVSFEQA